MTETWLPGFRHLDLRGRPGGSPAGPFGPGMCLGVAQHVNVGDTSDQWFAAGGGPASVLPNVQVHADGSGVQYLPLEWPPWCQADGNGGRSSRGYGAIEMAGYPNTPMTPAQMATAAVVVRAYHEVLGMPLQLATTPGQRGYITHAAGGAAWGGHPCPGTIRAAQMPAVLALAAGGGATLEDDELTAQDLAALNGKLDALTQLVTNLDAEVDNVTRQGQVQLGARPPAAGEHGPAGAGPWTFALHPGDTLHSGDTSWSPQGMYGLVVQAEDGNVVVYDARSRSTMSTGTALTGRRTSLTFQQDGNVVVRAEDGTPLWQTGTVGVGAAVFEVQDDGNVVVYDDNGRALWQAGIPQH